MKPCADYKETLLLDVYGELEGKELAKWKKHLEECPHCRKEKQRLLHMLTILKDTEPDIIHAPENPETLTNTIMHQWETEQQDKPWWQKLVSPKTNPFIPVMAMASLFIILFGWYFTTKPQEGPVIPTTENLYSEEQSIMKDMDIIENVELLEEMDALDELIKVVDSRDLAILLPARIIIVKKDSGNDEAKV